MVRLCKSPPQRTTCSPHCSPKTSPVNCQTTLQNKVFKEKFLPSTSTWCIRSIFLLHTDQWWSSFSLQPNAAFLSFAATIVWAGSDVTATSFSSIPVLLIIDLATVPFDLLCSSVSVWHDFEGALSIHDEPQPCWYVWSMKEFQLSPQSCSDFHLLQHQNQKQLKTEPFVKTNNS